jgi:hypothetical protein
MRDDGSTYSVYPSHSISSETTEREDELMIEKGRERTTQGAARLLNWIVVVPNKSGVSPLFKFDGSVPGSPSCLPLARTYSSYDDA